MLVRYRMNGSCTYANFVADITGIVNGSITSTSGLSAGADVGNSSIVGASYPTGYYNTANTGASAYAGAVTYMKPHNANASVNSYFTIGFNGSNSITNFTVGYGYANATNTYTVSNTYTFPSSIGIQSYAPIDIVVANNVFYISNPTVGAYGVGNFDLGYNGVSQAFPNTMINAIVPFATYVASTTFTGTINTNTITVTSATGIAVGQSVYAAAGISVGTIVTTISGTTITLSQNLTSTISVAATVNFYAPMVNPYSYYFSNAGYGASYLSLSYQSPYSVPYNSQGNVAILENPVFSYTNAHSNAISLIYSLNKINEGQYTQRAIYNDGTTYRYVVGTDSTTFSITV